MNDRMIGILPKLDYESLNKKFGKKNLTKESFGTKPNYEIIKAFIRHEESKQRQWKSTGEELYYYDSKISYHDGEDIVISDAGYKTPTTNAILTGLLEVLSDRLGKPYFLQPIGGTVTLSSQDNYNERYIWTGSLRIKPTPEENKELIDESGNSLKSTDTKAIQKKYRYKRKGIQQDAIKLKQAMEQYGWDVDLSTILDSNMYEVNIDLSSLFYEYLEKKGYRNPDFILSTIIREYNNVKINSIDIDQKDNKLIVDFNYSNGHRIMPIDLEPNITTDQLINKIENLHVVEREDILPGFLTWLME